MSDAAESSAPLWKPDLDRIGGANLTHFRLWVERKTDRILPDYAALHALSVEDVGRFWDLYATYTGVITHSPYSRVLDDPEMPGARWFEGMTLNYAENLLERGHSGPAIVWAVEGGLASGQVSFAELRALVARCARGLRLLGVEPGDRVAGVVANVPEAVIAALACASIGATWSSASPDFGLQAVVDRFGQVGPKIVFASDGYRYKGQTFETTSTVEKLPELIPTIEHVVRVPYPGLDLPGPEGAMDWFDLLAPDEPAMPTYEAVAFDHPLYVMFSSGTTGAPKCMVHGTGGTLLTHRKEHQLHCDIKPGDRLLYFTTCGWMMWNWQLSALSLGASIVLYDGNPAYPSTSSLWQAVNETQTTHFGTSGRHIEASMKSLDWRDLKSLEGLPYTRTILYTGSPLSEIGYRWIYNSIKSDVHLAGISGGTDILSCFVLGNPTLPVYAGEIQSRGLAVDVAAFDDEGMPVLETPGELVCLQPLPCMPVGFLDDPAGHRYRDAYFDHYPGVWRHGDFVTITSRGGAIMHGRSDATLNQGGVRIGSAELYAVLDEIDWVRSAVAVGFKPEGQSDEVIVLLVALAQDQLLTDDRVAELRSSIRTKCSPRHVPRHTFQVSDVPVTRSGKTVELSVKAVLEGRAIQHRSALANPQALDELGAIRDRLIRHED